jgi:hypothetical protein
MTTAAFDETKFKKGMRLLYRVRKYEITAVNFDTREVSFFNENGNEVWKSCEKIEIG